MSALDVHWLESLARASWQGGIALGLAWVLCHLAPQMSPRLRCWLWRLAYVKLLVALLWVSPVRLLLLPATSAATVAATTTRDEAIQPPARSTKAMQSVTAPTTHVPVIACMIAAWLLGVGVYWVRTAREWGAARRLKRQCQPIRDAELLACCEELCGRLGLQHKPRLLVAEGSGSPLLLGGLTPTIILPSGLCATCAPTELRLMLAHELAHLRRHDLWWCWLPSLVHGLFFFHPLVWVANREWRLSQEMACDEIALEITGAPVGNYGTVLLKVAAQGRPFLQPGLTAVSADEFPQALRRRLMAMKTMQTTNRRTSARMLGGGAALALAGVFGIIPWRVVAQEPAGQNAKAQQAASFRAEEEKNGWQRIVSKLKLTDIQQDRLKAMRADFDIHGHEIKADSAASPEERSARIRNLFDTAEQPLAQILLPGQLMTLEKLGGMKVLLSAEPGRKKMTHEDMDQIISERASEIESIGLTNTQKARLHQIFATEHSRVSALFVNQELSEDQLGASLKQLDGEVERFVATVLIPQQQQKLSELRQSESFQKVKASVADKVRRLESLNLTNNQKVRLQGLFQAALNRISTMFADHAMSEDQRMTELKMLHRDLEEQARAILTTEQDKKLFGEIQKAGE